MKKETKLCSYIDKACYDYSLIEDGDKILIGASGGKDSTALIQYFANRSKRKNCNFEYLALHIKNDFAPPFPSGILSLFEKWNVNFSSIDVNVLERVKEGRKMNCYWCSTQRRTELIHFALENGFNKIALGHHLDDILETFLMNMLNKGEIATMVPRLKYDNYPLTIIRPLCYVSENRLIKEAVDNNYAGFTCTCNFQDNSDRKLARKKLDELTNGDERVKQRMLNALKNIKSQYLP